MRLIAGGLIRPMGAAVLSVAELLSLTITVYTVLLLVLVLMSFTNPHGGNSALDLVYDLTKPILAPLQRVIPPAGGFDWSVLVAFVLLTLIRILILQPIQDIGRALA